ncbi:hypothetical protein ACFL27_04660 [candidate division CSSED10-310 bacterium]|uniref:Uncharacterized protein n=1 Tax=candidate division CSSED10-310 bacterium TaxID=2855610 RepID=A0ABV6YTF2_UNCC1
MMRPVEKTLQQVCPNNQLITIGDARIIMSMGQFAKSNNGSHDLSHCIGPECEIWVWKQKTKTGYCGLIVNNDGHKSEGINREPRQGVLQPYKQDISRIDCGCGFPI